MSRKGVEATERMGKKKTGEQEKSNARKGMFWMWGMGTYSEEL